MDNKNDTTKAAKYHWLALGNGNYNKVWKSNFDTPQALVSEEPHQGPWVLKYPITDENPVNNAMNNKDRAIRLWNDINKDLPKAGLHKLGWVAPYLENSRPATDTEIAVKVIEIFIKTRRIVVDAAITGNFLTDNTTGTVHLVDVDLALRRRDSVASINFHKKYKNRYSFFNEGFQRTMPKTLETIKNLFYLEDNLSASDIDSLCEQKKITSQSIAALSWLEARKAPLSMILFQQIEILIASGVPVDGILLESLCSDVNATKI
ncbi:MAG: hypothetical protein WC627_07185 [Legionella sp.]|jgi:hypothetical protein